MGRAQDIRLLRPPLGPADARALKDAVKTGWLGTGVFTRLFEDRLAERLRSPRILATNSGTAALQLALAALDVKGGEVVTTPLTNVATNHAILLNGAAPVFCDVEEDSGNLDPERLETCLTPRTRAIMVVHLHGRACRMRPILALARRRRLPVVEDACQALGARTLGTLGTFGCFSFGRFKPLTTLDGGAVACSDRRLALRVERLRRLGYSGEGPESVSEVGLHCRMNDLAAAVGLSQLERWPTVQASLLRLARRYRAGLAGLGWLRLPEEGDGLAHWAVRVAGGKRDALQRWLRARGVESEAWLYPNHLLEPYRHFRRKLPVAERLWREFLYLPFYPGLKDRETDRVVDAVCAFGRRG